MAKPNLANLAKSKGSNPPAAKAPETPKAAPSAKETPVSTVTASPAATPATAPKKPVGRQPGQIVKAAVPAAKLVEAAFAADSVEEFEAEIGKWSKVTPERVHIRRAVTELEEKGLTPKRKAAIELLRAYAGKHGYSADSMRGMGGGASKAPPKVGESRAYQTIVPKKGGKFVRVAVIGDVAGYNALFNADGTITLKPAEAGAMSAAKRKAAPANGVLYNGDAAQA